MGPLCVLLPIEVMQKEENIDQPFPESCNLKSNAWQVKQTSTDRNDLKEAVLDPLEDWIQIYNDPQGKGQTAWC